MKKLIVLTVAVLTLASGSICARTETSAIQGRAVTADAPAEQCKDECVDAWVPLAEECLKSSKSSVMKLKCVEDS